MESSAYIGIFWLLLQVYVTHQQVFWNDMMPYLEGPFLDYYYGINPFNPINSVYYTTEGNAVPIMLVPDSSIIQMNVADDSSKPTSSAPSESVKDYKQPIFQLFERPTFVKPQNPSHNTKTDIISSASNVQYFPGVTLPNYNQYYIPEFYETQYPQFGYNNAFIETTNPSPFFIPGVSYINKNEFLGQPNMNPYKKPIYLPNKDISSSDDETYKVALKSAINRQVPGNDSNRVRAFKTNFSGDISKCDMICKCRNIFVKPSASPEATRLPQPRLPLR